MSPQSHKHRIDNSVVDAGFGAGVRPDLLISGIAPAGCQTHAHVCLYLYPGEYNPTTADSVPPNFSYQRCAARALTANNRFGGERFNGAIARIGHLSNRRQVARH